MGGGGSKKNNSNLEDKKKWHYHNCTHDFYVETRSLKEADPESDMLFCDVCKCWVADLTCADKFYFCGTCQGAGKRLVLCKSCYKHAKPDVDMKPESVKALTGKEKADQFWSENFFDYGSPDGECLPGMVPSAPKGPDVYNDLIRPPNPRDEDEDDFYDSSSKRASSASEVSTTLEVMSPKSRRSSRSSPVRLASVSEASEDDAEPISPLTRRDSLRSLASMNSAASAPTIAWFSAPAPTGERVVPPSGIWSGAVTEGRSAKLVDREIMFHPDGRISGSGTCSDKVFIEGKIRYESGDLSWSEISPAGKKKVQGTVRFGDQCVVIRASVTVTSKPEEYLELTIPRASDAASGRRPGSLRLANRRHSAM